MFFTVLFSVTHALAVIVIVAVKVALEPAVIDTVVLRLLLFVTDAFAVTVSGIVAAVALELVVTACMLVILPLPSVQAMVTLALASSMLQSSLFLCLSLARFLSLSLCLSHALSCFRSFLSLSQLSSQRCCRSLRCCCARMSHFCCYCLLLVTDSMLVTANVVVHDSIARFRCLLASISRFLSLSFRILTFARVACYARRCSAHS